jgi:hypothetical protein
VQGPDDGGGVDTGSGGSSESGEEPTDIVLYSVQGNAMVNQQSYEQTGELLEFQKATDEHDDMWVLIQKIVPEDYFKNQQTDDIFGE